ATLLLFDTNVLWGDPWFEAPDTQALLMLNGHGVQVLVPDLVLREQENHVRREVSGDMKAVKRSLGKLSQLTNRSFSDPLRDVTPEAAAENYAKEIRKRLESTGTVILPMPEVSHAELSARAVLKRRPFSDNGKGYRDSLIWYSALEAIGETNDTHLIIVSKNVKDFGNMQGGLHSDLQDDVKNRWRETQPLVSLATNVRECWDKHLTMFAPRSRDLEVELVSEKFFGIYIRRWLNEEGTRALGGRSFGEAVAYPGVAEEFGPVVFSIERVIALDSPEVRKLPDPLVHVRFSARFVGMADVWEFRPDEEYADDDVPPRDPFAKNRVWSSVATCSGTFRADFSLLIDCSNQKVLAAVGQPCRRGEKEENGA
ncbi:MAG: PIN domain-containing protein, partial [Candidatus Poribacteria bacterium]|nr:PIN domain-containing protein [Candidatus Poribacteria bacterium]